MEPLTLHHTASETAPGPTREITPGAPRSTAGFGQRLWRGSETDPTWARPALWGLLVLTAAFSLWNLTSSGYANSFYSAAAQAGSVSWKAFFFGSSDAGNSITV
ncbi:MAG: glycosyl transferase, partial [Lapillicoccus sp.]